MSDMLASKVLIKEEEPGIRTVQGIPTGNLAAIGIAKRGPIGTPVRITSFDEYVKYFGGYTANGFLAQCLEGYFRNGGRVVYVSRTVHYADITDPASKTSAAAEGNLTTSGAATPGKVTSSLDEPFSLAHGDTLIVAVDGAPNQTATFQATAPTVTSTGVFPTGFGGGEVLTLSINGVTVSITFTVADQTAEAVALRINQQGGGLKAWVDGGNVVIAPDRRGTSATIQVTAGGANDTLLFPTALATGTGNVAMISGVTAAEIKAVVEAAVAGVTVVLEGDGTISIVSNTVGAGSSVQVQIASTADSKIGLDNNLHSGTAAGAGNTAKGLAKYDGDYGNDISIVIAAATSGEAARFNVTILEGAVIRESWPNRTMDSSDPLYLESISSDYVTFQDLHGGVYPANRPDNQTLALSGGDDGLVGLADSDFIGSDAGKTGLRAFDNTQDLFFLICPDRATPAVHNAMITYGEVTRERLFSILDPPAGYSAEEIVTYVDTTASLLELSEQASIAWPRILVSNPSQTIFGSGETVTVPPSGHIAGMYVRVHNSRPGGIYLSPAGVDTGVLYGCLGFETEEVMDEAARDLVYPKRINPITTSTGYPRYVDGGRTLKSTGNWPHIGQRLGVNFIEGSIYNFLQIYRHKTNNERTRASVFRGLKAFLITQMRNEAFDSMDPDTAFAIDVGTGLNTAAIRRAGQLLVRISLAMGYPIEWIPTLFSQDVRAINEELAA